MKKWVCTVCGYVYEGENPPEKCPQCGVPASKFKEQAADDHFRTRTPVKLMPGYLGGCCLPVYLLGKVILQCRHAM